MLDMLQCSAAVPVRAEMEAGTGDSDSTVDGHPAQLGASLSVKLDSFATLQTQNISK